MRRIAKPIFFLEHIAMSDSRRTTTILDVRVY